MRDIKFCTGCGLELVPDKPPMFDARTGEVLKQVCPSMGCGGHIGGRFNHKWRNQGFLWLYRRCDDCGAYDAD